MRAHELWEDWCWELIHFFYLKAIIMTTDILSFIVVILVSDFVGDGKVLVVCIDFVVVDMISKSKIWVLPVTWYVFVRIIGLSMTTSRDGRIVRSVFR